MEKLAQVRVRLSTGETRYVARSQGAADDAVKALLALQKSRDEWLETTDGTIVARAHIVEADVVSA
jgi:hypothetical protein